MFVAIVSMLALVACESSKPTEEVPFEVAKNYFFKSNLDILPASPKITTEEMFNNLFGMATIMGKDGKPTPIDFSKQFVLAVVLPVTDSETEINPMKVEATSDSLFYTYQVKVGEKQSFSIQPISIIILDKQYEDKEVVLCEE
jgi:hypothetical protein